MGCRIPLIGDRHAPPSGQELSETFWYLVTNQPLPGTREIDMTIGGNTPPTIGGDGAHPIGGKRREDRVYRLLFNRSEEWLDEVCVLGGLLLREAFYCLVCLWVLRPHRHTRASDTPPPSDRCSRLARHDRPHRRRGSLARS
jgi:hypothetical protein